LQNIEKYKTFQLHSCANVRIHYPECCNKFIEKSLSIDLTHIN
jgi:hypothetical protein